jgi:hypothetical protein
MKIKIPEKIKSGLDSIKEVRVEYNSSLAPLSDIHQDNALTSFIVSKMHIERVEFVHITDDLWQNSSFIQYRVEYINGEEKIFDFDNKEAAKYTSSFEQSIQKCLRINSFSIYEDNVQGRRECLDAVDTLISTVKSSFDTLAKNKTLIYYTLYFNTGYIELFNLSVESLLNNTTSNFDILVITDESTKKNIELTNSAKRKKIKYFITETPEDGVAASKKKVDIFQYPEILNYYRVLFLDCDIIAQANIDKLLQLELKGDVLYTAKNKNIGYHHFKTIHHGFICLSNKFIEEMKLAEQMPFNAGQFMFSPSVSMLQHFENVRWFMDNWPSEYFFEQCFMCYYFCRGYLTNITLLQKYIGLNSTTHTSIVDDDISNKILVHFIAPPLDAKTKLVFIENFLKKHKQSFLKKTLTKIKKFFKNLFKKHEQPTTY